MKSLQALNPWQYFHYAIVKKDYAYAVHNDDFTILKFDNFFLSDCKKKYILKSFQRSARLLRSIKFLLTVNFLPILLQFALYEIRYF